MQKIEGRLVETKENIGILLHRKLVMGRRVRNLAYAIERVLPGRVAALLDVGAGTGEMAAAVKDLRDDLHVAGVDVYVRPKTLIPVDEYDGQTMPYGDKEFDAVMLVDVLHHCDRPDIVLKECVRVSGGTIVIKDHVAENIIDRVLLRFMDWVGNRAHGVVLPYNYMSHDSWASLLEGAGLEIVESVDDLRLYPVLADKIFGGRLHCLWCLRMVDKND